MKSLSKHATVGLALATAMFAAGCGGDDRLSKAQTAKAVNGALQTVNGEFQAVFQQLGRREEGERVPSPVRASLMRAATVERRQAGDLDDIAPVAAAEEAVDSFIRAAHNQADALERAAARADLTVAELADTIELPAVREALAELARQGLAKPPPEHQ